MKLFSAAYAPNPRRVTMFLAEKGLDGIEIVNMDLPGGAHRSEEFRALSPLAQVPTLVLDDGRALTESRAICTYLEGLHPEPNLMGRDAFERASIEMWDRRVENMITLPLMMWVRHMSPALAAVERNQNAAVGQYNHDVAMNMLRWFDGELANRDYFAGDRLTVVDLTALAGIDFAKLNRWRPDETTPHLKRWRETMAQRPAGKVAP